MSKKSCTFAAQKCLYMKKNNLQVITIIAMMFLYAMIAFVTNLAAPVGKIWGESFSDPAQAERMGMLGNLFNFLAYLVMGIPAGNILSKIGYKKTALIALALGFVGIGVQWLSGVTDSFFVYLAGSLIGGFCVCMLNTVGNPMLNLLGGGGKKGNQLNLIGGTFQSLVQALTPMVVGAIIGTELAGKEIDDVNIVLYIAMAIFALIFVVIYFTPIAEPQHTGSDIVYEHSPFAFRHFTLGAVAIFCYMGIEIGVPATLVSYLKGLDGIGYDAATFMAGLFFIMMLIGRAIGSAVGGKVSSKAMVITVSSLAVVLMALAILLGDSVKIPMVANWSFDVLSMPLAAVLIMLVGLCGSVMWGSIFNLATEGLGKYTAKASGIFMTMVVGGGVLPYIQSAIAAHNCLISYLVPIACAAFILYYALLGSKNVNKDIKTD